MTYIGSYTHVKATAQAAAKSIFFTSSFRSDSRTNFACSVSGLGTLGATKHDGALDGLWWFSRYHIVLRTVERSFFTSALEGLRFSD